MARFTVRLIGAILVVLVLAGCSSGSGSGDDSPRLNVGHHQIEGQNVFTVDENGNVAASMEKELAEKLGAEAGYSVRFVKIDTPAPDNSVLTSADISPFFQALVDKLNDNSVDVVIGNLSVLPKREAVVDYLESHLPDGAEGYSYPVAFVVKEGNSDLKGELDPIIREFDSDGTLDSLIAKYGVE